MAAALFVSAYPLLELRLKDFLKELTEKVEPVEVGVGVEGPGAAYALVWEYGNMRQTKKGPKTVLGINPDGRRVWLSSQAPRGYIRVHEPLYWAAFNQELRKLTFGGTTTGEIQEELVLHAMAVAKKIRDIISEHAPVDSGELQSDIRVLGVGDPILREEDDSGVLVFAREG